MHSGHSVVEDDSFYRMGFEEREAGFSVQSGDDLISGTLKDDTANLQTDCFVVDAKY